MENFITSKKLSNSIGLKLFKKNLLNDFLDAKNYKKFIT